MPKEYVVEGPFSSYEMDKKFKARELTFEDQVGISRQEFFDFKYLIEIVYPLPKVRNFDGSSVISRKGETQTTIGANDKNLSHLFKSAKKFNRIWDESDKASVGFSEQATPFKRTPFKNILGANPKGKPNKDGFIEVDNELMLSAKKSTSIPNETFIVKSWKKAFPRVPKSSQEENKRRRVFTSLTDVKLNATRKNLTFKEDTVVRELKFIKEEKEEVKKDVKENENDSDFDDMKFSIKDDTKDNDTKDNEKKKDDENIR